MKEIITKRLTLVPVTLAILEELDSDSTMAGGYGFAPGWPTVDTLDILPMMLDTLRKGQGPSGFEFWMMVEQGLVIGDIGFHGPPDADGVVEIGMGIVSQKRKQGYGLEALQGLLCWCLAQPKVRRINADCLLENLPSQGLLRKAGFRETGRDEHLIYWTYSGQA